MELSRAITLLRSPLRSPDQSCPRRKAKNPIGKNVFYASSPPAPRVHSTTKLSSPAVTISLIADHPQVFTVGHQPHSPSAVKLHPTVSVAEPSTPAPSAKGKEVTLLSSPPTSADSVLAIGSPRRVHEHFVPHHISTPGTDLDKVNDHLRKVAFDDPATPLGTPLDEYLISPEDVRCSLLPGNPPPKSLYENVCGRSVISSKQPLPTYACPTDFGSPFDLRGTTTDQLGLDIVPNRRFSTSSARSARAYVRAQSPPPASAVLSPWAAARPRSPLLVPVHSDFFTLDYSLNDPVPAQSTPPPITQEYFSPDTFGNALKLDVGTDGWDSACATPYHTIPPEPSLSLPVVHFNGPHPLDNYPLSVEFAKRFSLDAELGSGGFGFVVSATQTGYHNQAGVEVAVKFIMKNRLTAYDMEGGWPREAWILHQCQHQNIVRFVDLYHDNEYWYLIQEIHGSPWQSDSIAHHVPSLGTVEPHQSPSFAWPVSYSSTYNPSIDIPHPNADIDMYRPIQQNHGMIPEQRPGMGRRASHDLFEAVEYKRFSEEEARYIFRQIVDAVVYMHERGIHHRDLKDENITIDKKLTVKIIDFGSAVKEDKANPRYHDVFRGTMAYAPAEILLGHSYLAGPADVWALGILLSIIVTGETPFPSIDWAVSGRIQTKQSVSRGVTELLSMCLTPDPRIRPTVDVIRNHPWFWGYRCSSI